MKKMRQEGHYIVADIGGTNARLELRIRLPREGALFSQTLSTQQYSSCEALIMAFMSNAGYSGDLELVVLGIPGDIKNNSVRKLPCINSYLTRCVQMLSILNVGEWFVVTTLPL